MLLSWRLLNIMPSLLDFAKELCLQSLHIFMALDEISNNEDNIFWLLGPKQAEIEIENNFQD